MSGLRIHQTDKDAWGCTILIPHPGDPSTGRKGKDYYLRLDTQGDIIVSETVWMRLQECEKAGFHHGFVMVNVVENPPPIVMGATPEQKRRTFKLIDNVLQELAPPGTKGRVVKGPRDRAVGASKLVLP